MAETVAGIFLLTTAIVAINWRLDFYGLFGQGGSAKRVRLKDQEYLEKFLLSYRYIPEHFDALLIGSSVPDGFDASKVRGYRMFNLGLGGANTSDLRLIVENELAQKAPRLVLFCLDSYMLETHGANTRDLEPRTFWRALGSTALFSDYAAALWQDWKGRYVFGEDGHLLSWSATEDADEHLERWFKWAQTRHFDETSFAELSEVFARARATGARIAGCFTPEYAPRFALVRAQRDALYRRLRTLFRPGEVLVNFNDGSFGELTHDKRNFADGVHLTHEAADKVASVLDEAINGPVPQSPVAAAPTAAGP